MAKVLIDVCVPVKTRTGEDYREPMVRNGEIMLVGGGSKQQHQITPEDRVVMETVPVGRIICLALDAKDDKATSSDLRKRFVFSGKIEKAMQDKKPLEIEPEERQMIDATYELIKSGMFQQAIVECLANSQPVKKPVKAA